MNINRLNYSVYFLDYKEGKLTPDQVAELLIWLEQNRDMESKFYSMGNWIKLKDDKNISFSDKKYLKLRFNDNADISIENYEHWLIRKAEGDLNGKEIELLNGFLDENYIIKKEAEYFDKLRLAPDKTVTFYNKDILKHRTKVIYPILWKAVPYAAAALLLLLIYFNLPKSSDHTHIVGINKKLFQGIYLVISILKAKLEEILSLQKQTSK